MLSLLPERTRVLPGIHSSAHGDRWLMVHPAVVLPSPVTSLLPCWVPGTPSQTNLLHLNPRLGLSFWGNLSKGRDPGHAVVGPALSLTGWVASMTVSPTTFISVSASQRVEGCWPLGRTSLGPEHARSSGIGEMGPPLPKRPSAPLP